MHTTVVLYLEYIHHQIAYHLEVVQDRTQDHRILIRTAATFFLPP